LKTFSDSIPAPPHRRRPVWGICFCGDETSPTSSHQLIQREPLAVTADFADCQSLSLWERCLQSRRRGQARQNETRKRSDTMPLTNRVCIAVRFAFCQHPCPLRRIRASSPKGRASGGNSRLCGLPKPLTLGEVSAEQTERASPVKLLQRRCDTMSLTNRVCIAVRFAFCQHPCPLRRIRASSPKGRASGEEALCISPIHTGIYYTDTTKWVGGNGICLW